MSFMVFLCSIPSAGCGLASTSHDGIIALLFILHSGGIMDGYDVIHVFKTLPTVQLVFM